MFSGANIPSSSTSHIVNSKDESNISRKRKCVDNNSLCSKVKRPNLDSSDDEFVDNSSFYSNGNSKLVVHKSSNIVNSKCCKVLDKPSALVKVVEKKASETKSNSFGLEFNVEKKYVENGSNSFNFVLNKAIEEKLQVLKITHLTLF